MSKILKPAKKSVELDKPVKVSRIRRDPVPINHAGAEKAEKKVVWRTSEREIALAVIGIVLFALAIDIVVVALSAYTSSTGPRIAPTTIVVRQ